MRRIASRERPSHRKAGTERASVMRSSIALPSDDPPGGAVRASMVARYRLSSSALIAAS
jgi:hypothetical protein